MWAGAGAPVTLTIGELPAEGSTVTLTFDVIGAHSLAVEVLGEDPVAPASVLASATNDARGVPWATVTYVFAYPGADKRVRLGAAPGGAAWGLDNVAVMSAAADAKPAAVSKALSLAANAEDAAVELSGTAADCSELAFRVTSLPTEGLLYKCGCDTVWAAPLTAADLPATVGGACHRLVYEPRANAHGEDAFTYVAADANGIASPEARPLR